MTITYEIGNRLKKESIYNAVSMYGKYFIARIAIKVFLLLLQHSSFFQNYFFKLITKRAKELLLILKGYGEILRDSSTESISIEYRKISIVLPVYEKLDLYLQKNKLFNELSQIISALVSEMQSLEATLELYLDATTARNIMDAENDLRNNRENFSEWIPVNQ